MNREAPAHAIVLLSEMYSFVDWRAVADAVASASDDVVHRALFHVFDLQELVSLARDCVDSAALNHRLIRLSPFERIEGQVRFAVIEARA